MDILYEERMNKTGSKWTINFFDFGFADEEERRNNFFIWLGRTTQNRRNNKKNDFILNKIS